MEFKSNVKDRINDYGRRSAFSSFLPGIAGQNGIPIWCYYVNRGQAVVSFGVQDKDHGIMEFYPAHTAYQTVSKTGFRTFIRMDGRFYEPFAGDEKKDDMTIYMNSLELEDTSENFGLKTKVSYSILPNEEIGALIRGVEITNITDEEHEIEVLDGMPALVPFGVGQESLKMMMQTTKAWMQVEDSKENRPYYRVRVSMEDSAEVTSVDGGNFAIGRTEDGKVLPVVVDPNVIFGYDLSLDKPVEFINRGLQGILEAKQNVSNELPSAFFGMNKNLKAGETVVIYELIGQVRNKETLTAFLEKNLRGDYFTEKFAEAEQLANDLTKVVSTKTGNTIFDNYCRYNYMDNALRGGVPIKLGDKHTFYVYSRKHGDLERDYNYFSMSAEHFSQGNGNFRDVNQNRRCDTFFSPVVEDYNIKMFYSLIQLDGYNPLKIEQLRYTLKDGALKGLNIAQPFTPGELLATLTDAGRKEEFINLMNQAEETVGGDFGEGFWTDHWTYNLDLIDEYLEIYPDRKGELLFDTRVKSFDAKVEVLPRFSRYVNTKHGIRQYNYLKKRENTDAAGSYAVDKAGNQVEMSLVAKMVLMSAIKFATLDAHGMGIEMEGGKPGWYDALNGMPGMLGSSMNDTYELKRMVDFLIDSLDELEREVTLPEESSNLLVELGNIEKKNLDDFESWNKRNDLKEKYRNFVYENISGKTKTLQATEVVEILKLFANRLFEGITEAVDHSGGISPAYFTYEIDEYKDDKGKIVPTHFKLNKVPHFLEGPVRYLKLGDSYESKRLLHNRVKNSDLYDKKLSMFKVNESLEDASFELGRCRAFTPGWLENESIWLHMEYKYLLELLRSGLYQEFFEAFRDAAIPFLDKETYGRSTLENSSFIASSANPNEKIHGKGFVARLSGSTIEFISMWKLMFFGKSIFELEDENLVFNPTPAIPEYLIGDDLQVNATLLGTTEVIYQFSEKANYYPEDYKITEVEIEFVDGEIVKSSTEKITGPVAEKIRDRKAKEITIKMTP